MTELFCSISCEVTPRAVNYFDSPKNMQNKNPLRPITLRLPRAGARDELFGLTRTAYYDLEKRGLITLIRLVPPGKTRGTVLIPVDEVERYLAAVKEVA